LNDFDLISIQVLPFSGKKDEWPISSEKFFAKAKRSGYKDVSLAKVNITETDEYIILKTEEEIFTKNADLNKIVYKGLMLLIDVRGSRG
jgi:hypothetical protein